ncbi:exosortase/archaeosortase family protein [Streptomyces sp. IBSNAI002]|uniref:exosortase/archaeosortase family protein n=1 Tax=Streptomyces sp. IBSNAI002 TaxID=3457500 RepID=UPI003FD4828C
MSVATASTPSPRPARSRADLAFRIPLALSLVALSVGVFRVADQIRVLEALVASRLTTALLGLPARHSGGSTAFYFDLSNGQAHGLRITDECTSAYILGVLPVLAALWILAVSGVGRATRALTGLTIGAGIFCLANSLRVVMIVFSMDHLGEERGFELAHRYLGTVLTLVALAASAAVVMVFLGAGRRSAERGADRGRARRGPWRKSRRRDG